jgi:cell wall assembly regulator SMI1
LAVIRENGPPLKEETVSAFERLIGAKLPSDYRQFLVTHNGGRPEPDTIEIQEFPASPTNIQVFFGFDRQFETSDLRWNREIVGNDLGEPDLLPIACDSFGDPFCVRLAGSDYGVIYFVNFEESVPHRYYVAASFSALLLKLRDWEGNDASNPGD